jgi:hypothetical protein
MASRRQGVGRSFTEKLILIPPRGNPDALISIQAALSPLRVPRSSARWRPQSKSKTASDYNGLLLGATILDEIRQSAWGRVGTLL